MICLFAPYNRSETTAAAIRLASLVVALGSEVRYVSIGKQERGIHPLWDHKVWSSYGNGVYMASRNCGTFVHFHVGQQLRKMTELVAAKNARHLFVPQWHQLQVDDVGLMLDHHLTVCPTRQCKDGFKSVVFQGNDVPITQLTWCRFDAGIKYVQRHGPLQDHKLSVVFVVNRSCVDALQQSILPTMDKLLENNHKLSLTLLRSVSCDGRTKEAIAGLRKRYAERFVVKTQRSLDLLTREFHAHDWAVFPWTRGEFGIHVLRAQACGVPVIAYDIEPFSEVIQHNVTGLLTRCDVENTDFHAPIARPAPWQLLEVCQSAFANHGLLCKMQAKNWHLDQLSEQFNKYWAKALDIVRD